MTNVVLFIAKQFGLLWTCFPAISVEYHYIMWCLYNIKRFEGSKLCQNGDRMLKNMCSAARRTCFWLGGVEQIIRIQRKRRKIHTKIRTFASYTVVQISPYELFLISHNRLVHVSSKRIKRKKIRKRQKEKKENKNRGLIQSLKLFGDFQVWSTCQLIASSIFISKTMEKLRK